MMKAAQGPGVGGGGMPLGAPNPGSHSPNHQSMHPGNESLMYTFDEFEFVCDANVMRMRERVIFEMTNFRVFSLSLFL